MTNRAIPGTGKSWPICATVLLWLTAGNSAFSQPAGTGQADPTGEWLVAQRIAKIKIVDCGGRLWGVVAWETQPGTDAKNPDPKLRTRPTLGMPVLLDMAPTQPMLT